MKYRVHYYVAIDEGSDLEDSFIVEGNDIGLLRIDAEAGVKARGGYEPWSEKLEG